MLKKNKFVFGIIFFLWMIAFLAQANGVIPGADVVILIEGQEQCQVSGKQIVVQADVMFNKASLMNDSLFLSYHIYDANNNLLLFEGNRIRLNAFDQNAVKGVPVAIDLSKVRELDAQKQIRITLDVADEKNVFWFSKNEAIRFSTATILYDVSLAGRTKRVIAEIAAHPILLGISILLYGAGIYGWICYKKSNAAALRNVAENVQCRK